MTAIKPKKVSSDFIKKYADICIKDKDNKTDYENRMLDARNKIENLKAMRLAKEA